ncbi:MAG: hypothetical protein IK020_04115 [Clostridiales bacterium]|nr:hypothetical protein [Clostridiales bacterium]
MKKLITTLLILSSLMMFTSCATKPTDASVSPAATQSTTDQKEAKEKMEEIFQKKCSADEALELAKRSDVVVFEDVGCTFGQEVWDAFYKSVSDGLPAAVLCANYYTLDGQNMSEELYEQEKDNYPVLYFTLLEYDGKEFSIQVRDSSSDKLDRRETFKYLNHYTGDAPATAIYKHYEYYVLVDDADTTWEQIEQGNFSSQYGDMIRHSTVYTNYT